MSKKEKNIQTVYLVISPRGEVPYIQELDANITPTGLASFGYECRPTRMGRGYYTSKPEAVAKLREAQERELQNEEGELRLSEDRVRRLKQVLEQNPVVVKGLHPTQFTEHTHYKKFTEGTHSYSVTKTRYMINDEEQADTQPLQE